MKLAQQEQFSPIALIFETREEAECFWDILLGIEKSFQLGNEKQRAMIMNISNLFTNEARL